MHRHDHFLPQSLKYEQALITHVRTVNAPRRPLLIVYPSRDFHRDSSSPRGVVAKRRPVLEVPSLVHTTRLACSVVERTSMADATRYNGAVSRLHAITAAVMLLTRIRAAAAASPTLGTCPFSHRAYREASSGHLQKIFDRAGFDTSRGAMWFTKHDDAPLDCEDCHHVSSASAYGCPMLVRALSSPPSLTRKQRRNNKS